MRESNLQSRIYEALNANPGCKAVITHGLESGTPDILGCYRGRLFAIEVKTAGSPLTTIQRHRMRQWEKAGAFCCGADEEFSVPKFLEAMAEEG